MGTTPRTQAADTALITEDAPTGSLCKKPSLGISFLFLNEGFQGDFFSQRYHSEIWTWTPHLGELVWVVPEAGAALLVTRGVVWL